MADFFDPATGTFVVAWWGAIALLALFVALTVIAVLRAGGVRAITVFAQVGAVAVALFGGWTILDRMDQRERADERRAFDTRMADLAARAMAPGSALGCLDPLTADALDEACEKAIFNNPESVAAATSYVSARLSLLAEAVELEGRNPGGFDQAIAALRNGLERDRYGVVAHILAARGNCDADQCEAFGLLNDATRVAANLRSHAFETRIAKASTTASTHQPQTAAAAPAGPSLAAVPAASAANVAFPSASSIPPVSIMNNEPGATGQNGMDDAKTEAKAEPKPTAPRRQAEKPAPRREQAQSPKPLTPSRADAASRVQ